jgi:hypothetical protein
MHSRAKTSAEIDDNFMCGLLPLIVSPEIAPQSSQKKSTADYADRTDIGREMTTPECRITKE